MIEKLFKDIYDEELAKDAIINDRVEGFREDYLILHCLLRKHSPAIFMEIGTHTGMGTVIIKNALGDNSMVFSLDLPDSESGKSKQHPISEGKKGVGCECLLSYIQLRGDSTVFPYSDFACDGYYCDGEHVYENVYAETKGMLSTRPKIIIYHDADIEEVYQAIVDAIKNEQYYLYRVINTRIAYALRNDI